MILLNNNYYNILKNELQLSDLEIKIFLLIINEGMRTLDQISLNLFLDKLECKKIIEKLMNKKMIIEYSDNLFETFHPKFAIINRYKNMCITKKITFQKNVMIDNLASALEKSFDAARTK